MIIINLKGGLGNQLFQYACGRAITLRNPNSLYFDITGYAKTKNSDTPRDYLLSNFNINDEKIATEAEVLKFKYPKGIVSKFYRKLRTKLGLFNVGYVPRILNKKGNFYLDGYWQSEKYFIDFANIIRKELSLKNPLGSSAQLFVNLINNSKKDSETVVSLHMRRGDVARDSATNPYYGICTSEYYSKAIKHVTENVKNPHFFVFSDGMDWTKENIKIPFKVTYVEDRNIADYEELILMSKCDHHIIANSSFSWWGAWLNPNSNKIVVAPKQWIKTRQLQHKDTVPNSWIRV